MKSFIHKLVLGWLLLCAALSCHGATIIYPLTNWLIGVTATNSIQIYQVDTNGARGGYSTDGTHFFVGPAIWLTPKNTGSTNGIYTNRMNGGNYAAFIQSDPNQPPYSTIYFSVPFNDTNIYQLGQLQTNPPVVLNSGVLRLTNDDGSVALSAATGVVNIRAVGGGGTNGNTVIVSSGLAGTTNGSVVTIKTNGAPVTSATNYLGSNVGDVTGTQAATVVATVGTSTAANVHAAELLANAATTNATANTLVKRDANGFANLNPIGDGSGLTNLLSRGYLTPADFGAQGAPADDTAAIQNAFYSGFPILFPPNTNFICGNLFLTNGTVILGNGGRLTFKTDVSGVFITGTNTVTNFVIHDITLDGLKTGFGAAGGQLSWTFQATSNVTQNVSGLHRTGLSIGANQCLGIVQLVRVSGFSDVGINLYGTAENTSGGHTFPQPTNNSTRIDNCSIVSCFIGMSFTNSAEYAVVSGISAHQCGKGFYIASGNDYVNFSQVTGSGQGVEIDGGGSNPAHGQFNGCIFNHDDIFCVAYGTANGHQFNNCFVLGSGIQSGSNMLFITNFSGFIFNGGEFSGGRIICDGGTGTHSGPNVFNPSSYQTGSGSLVDITTVNGGILKSLNNGVDITGTAEPILTNSFFNVFSHSTTNSSNVYVGGDLSAVTAHIGSATVSNTISANDVSSVTVHTGNVTATNGITAPSVTASGSSLILASGSGETMSLQSGTVAVTGAAGGLVSVAGFNGPLSGDVHATNISASGSSITLHGGAGETVVVGSGGLTLTGAAGGFIGPGQNLTALNASQLTSGTVPDARFPATLPAASGANLTSLNGSAVSSGTVAPARLGSGSPSSANFLRGDGAWVAGASGVTSVTGDGTFTTGTITTSGSLTPVLTPIFNASLATSLNISQTNTIGASIPGVIYDDDFGPDIDMVPSLMLLYNAVNNGACNLLAVTCDTSPNQRSGVCAAAIIGNHYGIKTLYGQSTNTLALSGGTADTFLTDNFASGILNNLSTNSANAVTLWRQVMANAPSHSVRLILTGQGYNYNDFLKSPADNISSKTGWELASNKLEMISCFGGDYTNGWEFNFVSSSNSLPWITNSPNTVPIYWAGNTLGSSVKTLATTWVAQLQTNNPAYMYATNKFSATGRECWDQLSIALAIYGTNIGGVNVFSLYQGTNTVTQTGVNQGSNYWVFGTGANFNQYFLSNACPTITLSNILNTLIVGNQQPTVTAAIDYFQAKQIFITDPIASTGGKPFTVENTSASTFPFTIQIHAPNLPANGTVHMQIGRTASATKWDDGYIGWENIANGTANNAVVIKVEQGTGEFRFDGNGVTTSTKGFGSGATNTYSMTSTGFTNATAKIVRVVGATGTTPYFSNITSHVNFSLGTITVPTSFTLQTNECLVGTSMAAAGIVDE